MHGAVDIVQQVVCFRDQLKAFTEQALLNLLLTSSKELIGITWLQTKGQAMSIEVKLLFAPLADFV
jgi:hypothetical protein